MLPNMIKDAVLSIDGFGYAGRVDNITPPKLTRKMEEYTAGGMEGPVEIDFGTELQELTFDCAEESAQILSAFGICDVAGINYRINAAAETDDEACTTNAIEIICRGRAKEIDPGSYQRGDKANMSVSVSVAYYKYSLNGITLVEYDPVNNILITGGVDRREKRRLALKQ